MTDKRVGLREVREQFGVGPEAVIDIMALMGDSIDNVKGLPGVGPKTAADLLGQLGTLDAIYGGLDQVSKPKLRETATSLISSTATFSRPSMAS